jgi:hypothetical protein
MSSWKRGGLIGLCLGAILGLTLLGVAGLDGASFKFYLLFFFGNGAILGFSIGAFIGRLCGATPLPYWVIGGISLFFPALVLFAVAMFATPGLGALFFLSLLGTVPVPAFTLGGIVGAGIGHLKGEKLSTPSFSVPVFPAAPMRPLSKVMGGIWVLGISLYTAMTILAALSRARCGDYCQGAGIVEGGVIWFVALPAFLVSTLYFLTSFLYKKGRGQTVCRHETVWFGLSLVALIFSVTVLPFLYGGTFNFPRDIFETLFDL